MKAARETDLGFEGSYGGRTIWTPCISFEAGTAFPIMLGCCDGCLSLRLL